jgi:hypothetical protein
MKFSPLLLPATLALLLSACGGSGSSDSTNDEGSTPPAEEVNNDNEVYGPFSTGSASEPATVYYDLETQSTLELSDEDAASNTQWDIAFRRTKVWLNTAQEAPVSVYFTGNNADFYDAEGSPVTDRFTSATAESELDDFEAVTLADVPDAESFSSDTNAAVIGDSFYHYDMTTHTVSAADEVFYIVSSDSTYAKFRVTNIATVGRLMGEITLEIAAQSTLDGQSEFAQAKSLTIQTEGCSENSYIDFDTQTTATQADDWDLMLTCDDGGASFSLTLVDDATVIRTDGQTYAGIDPAAAPYMGFTSDSYTEYAFDAHPWYFYDGNSHLLYSQFGVYLIQAGDITYKFQITSYYDNAGTSGSYSFRAAALTE